MIYGEILIAFILIFVLILFFLGGIVIDPPDSGWESRKNRK